MAYAPGNKKTNVFRAGVGVFNDRSGPVVIADVLHSQPGGLIKYVITNPGYPDPFASAAAAAAQPPSIVQLAPDVQIPQTVQYSVGLDHQLQKTTTLSLTYTGARGYHLFRSRDINAPLPPLYLARPDPAYGVVRQVESTGRQDSDSLQVTLRGRVTRWFNGQMQYTLSRVDNDTNGIASFPANDYDLSGEWARADFDRRHRFLLLGRVSAGKAVDLGVGVDAELGRPVHGNARPGHLQQRPRTRASCRRRAQHARRRRLRDARPARLARSEVRRRQGRAHDDARARRLQPAEPRQLRKLRRHRRLSALRPAGLGATSATTAVFRAPVSSSDRFQGSTILGKRIEDGLQKWRHTASSLWRVCDFDATKARNHEKKRFFRVFVFVVHNGQRHVRGPNSQDHLSVSFTAAGSDTPTTSGGVPPSTLLQCLHDTEILAAGQGFALILTPIL